MAEKTLKNPNGAGRKWFDGKNEEEVVAKLKQVWSIGGNDIEAYSYAEISRDSYYKYLRKHPELANRKEQLKQKPILAARMTIANNIQLDVDTARWYLERKRKDEFGNKIGIDLDVHAGKKSRDNIKMIIGILTGGMQYDFTKRKNIIQGEVVENEKGDGETNN